MIYHKINSVFKRDQSTNYKTFLMWEWADPAFGYLQDLTWVATEKVDGTNMRLHVEAGTYHIGGRTDNAQIHKDLEAHMHEIGERAVAADLEGLTLYGEGYGAGIQKGGGAYRPDKAFILFDIATDSNMFLNREDVVEIGLNLDIPVVPVAATTTLADAIHLFGHGDISPSVLRDSQPEGWVLRPQTELRNRRGQRVITKLKVRDFES